VYSIEDKYELHISFDKKEKILYSEDGFIKKEFMIIKNILVMLFLMMVIW
jgi:hypothetical protein